MFKNNKNLFIIALIAVVNALGYGIIIPILYSYSVKYGLSDFQNGLLFATFSLCQFLATPLIGRLSDKYGRRPLLLISLAGTAASFFMMAFAPSALFLFLARALDGITSGNIPVAAAVISDTTEQKDRARGFGIIGASFGFGFIGGPAISGFMSRFGLSMPFIIAGIISIIAVILTYFILPETNKHIGVVTKRGKLIDLPKLIHALADENVGRTLLISLFFSMTFGLFLYAIQPYAVKILGLNVSGIAIIFTIFGIVGLFSQTVIIPLITKKFGVKRSFSNALALVGVAYLGIFLLRWYPFFLVVSIMLGIGNSFVNPLIQTLLSEETDEKSQGAIQGLNASYISIGTIIGPVVGGILATFAIPLPFLFASLIAFLCFGLSFQILNKTHLKPIDL